MAIFHELRNAPSEEFCQRISPGSVNLVLTDPPFGVDNLSNMAVTSHGKAHARKIANDETPEIAIETFKKVMNSLLPKTADVCDAYVFTSYQVLEEWLVMAKNYMASFGFEKKANLIWVKDGPGMGDLNSPWGMAYEIILFFQKGRREKSVQRRNGVLHFPQVRPADLIHPHEKPIPLLETLIRTSTDKGDFVVDPFAGSGSTVRAAKLCERNCLGIEYDKKNYDLALKALENKGGGFF